MLNKLLLSALTATSLIACGGGGSSSSDSPSNPEPTRNTGVFIDSAVSNIDYRTETIEGTTSESGEFEYMTGETVTFSLGNLDLPPVTAIKTITPLTLFKTTVLTDPEVVNLIRLLQSLDKDGNPDNGILITDAAKSMADNIDLYLPVIEFESSTPVLTLLTHAELDTHINELISAADALEHFEESLDSILKFNATEINDSAFIISFTSGGSLSYYLTSTGLGLIDDGNGLGSVTSWEINSAGALVIETEDFTDTYTLVSGNSTSGKLSIHINDKSDGLSDTTGSISKIVGVFTPLELAGGGAFKVTFSNSSDFLNYSFTSNGAGEVAYTDGNFDEITWSINAAGALVVTTPDFTDTYTLTDGNAASGSLSIHVNDKLEGISTTTGAITKR